VLPTGGCACHSSGLSVQTFLKGIHIVEYNEPALAEVAQHVVTLANAEDLPAHGEAVLARRQPEPESTYVPELAEGAEQPPITDQPLEA
jgi:histidinol dehydrogenase